MQSDVKINLSIDFYLFIYIVFNAFDITFAFLKQITHLYLYFYLCACNCVARMVPLCDIIKDRD